MQQVIENPQPIGNLMTISICFKVRGPFVENFCIKKTHILTPFNVQIASNYAFLFQNKENKTLLGPPPPPKRLRDTNGRNIHEYGYMHKCLPIPADRDLDIY